MSLLRTAGDAVDAVMAELAADEATVLTAVLETSAEARVSAARAMARRRRRKGLRAHVRD